MKKIALIAGSLLLLAIGLIWPTDRALANGTEELGPPTGITLATGTGIVAAGTGLALAQPGSIEITVPDGAAVQQVLLYWEGQMLTNAAGDDTILINGTTEVTGQLIGGPAYFFRDAGQNAYSSAYRADITSLNLIGAGTNTVAVGGLSFSKVTNGAGLLVIYDDGTTPAAIGLRDGVDLAFINFPEPRKSTVPQTVNFPASGIDRVANVVIFASSVEGEASGQDNRPDSIEITVAGVTKTFSNPLNSYDGEEWDTLDLQVPVPAGADSITMQLFSRDDEGTGDLPASMTWIGTAFAIVPPATGIDIEKATNGEDADTATGPQIPVGDPVEWTYVVVNTGDVTLNNVTVTDDQNVTVTCPQTTLAPGETMTCTGNGIAVAGQYANLGSVIGTPANGDIPVRDSDLSHYFGLEPELAAVGDRVFRDDNANGIQDGGEGGVDGIIVELYAGDSTLISSTTTVDGLYFFDNLQPGEYFIKFINPLGTGVCTTPNVGNDDAVDSDGAPVADAPQGPACQTAPFSLVGGQTDLTRDLGLVFLEAGINLEKATNGEDADTPTGPQIRVGDPVLWTYDVTNTGGVTLTDVTVTDNQGVTVVCPQTILGPGGSMRCTATGTATEGQYANIGSVVGTPTNNSGNVSDTDPSHYIGYQPAAVGNFVFGDIDPDGATPEDIAGGNGIQDGDPREQGIDGIIVKLYNGDSELISRTVTANGGQYRFGNLVPGEYCLVFVNPGAGVWTEANVVSDDTIDSDAGLPATDPEGEAMATPCFTLESGETDLTWDAGLVGLSGAASAAAGNRVWVDETANGIQDGDEPGRASVTVQIYTEAGELVEETQTDNQGIYNFTALDPGSYYIEFTVPTDCQLTEQKVGDDDDVDSDIIDLVNNRTRVFTLEPFETNPRFDMGITCTPSGLDPNEEPLQNKIYLPIIR